jgi:DNA-binding FadR family transcriptional regulator
MSKEPLYRIAQRGLTGFIRENRLSPGDRLPSETLLADLLGVSRPSLREASRSLQALGIVDVRPGSGLYVSDFSFHPLIDQLPYGLADSAAAFQEILTVREGMESGLMPALARLPASTELVECAAIAERMAVYEQRGEAIDAVDRDFHLRLYRPLGNTLVDRLIELFWDVFARLRRAMPDRAESDRAAVHTRIVSALQAADSDAAVAHMRLHFDDLRRRAASLTGVAGAMQSAEGE